MLRIWGGGLYEREYFYETCDKLGILAWQDFMYACSPYPANKEFLDNIKKETVHQIRRLAHHPSIALWCGNNEIEGILLHPHRKRHHYSVYKWLKTEYHKLFIRTIYPIVKKEDPGRRYWPSSPSSGISKYGNAGDHSRGDEHYWHVWHGDGKYTDYLKVKPRFVSEFGFQSFASPETMAAVTKKEDRNITSPVFEFHQRSWRGHGTILSFALELLPMPVGYENTIYISQILHALYMKIAVEHWRRSMPRTMGTLIWQLNDIWPVASWASLEYDGRWKALHYLEKKFYAPLLVSSCENKDNIEIWATSDLTENPLAELKVLLININGKALHSYKQKLKITPLSSKKIFQIKISELCADEKAKSQCFLYFTLQYKNYSSSNFHFFMPYKKLELKKPKIAQKLYIEKSKITLSLKSDTLALFTWIRHGNIHGTWSDNGMHLLPNKETKIFFTPRYKCTLSEMKKKIKIHNLYDAGF